MKAFLCKECKFNANGWCHKYKVNGPKRTEVCDKYKDDSELQTSNGILINGTIFSQHLNTDVDETEFKLAFLQMCKEHDWIYSGDFKQIDDSNEL